jgi:hypothetical protein
LRKLRGLGGDPLEDVVDERVEDEHGLVGDTGVGVDLLEDLVDVGRVGLLALRAAATLLLLALSGRLGLSSGLVGYDASETCSTRGNGRTTNLLGSLGRSFASGSWRREGARQFV